MSQIPKIKLNDGNEIPQLGFGVFQIPDHDEALKVVETAINNGYRLIDTAEAYNNQKAVGEAIKNTGVDRSEIFLTTKLWVSNFTYEKATAAIDNDLKELGTDYIDLMLLHQPYGDVAGAWRALEEAQKSGKIKSIGVSNFYPDQLINLQLMSDVKPAVNQIEINPWYQREPEVDWFQDDDVTVEAWAPFAEGKNDIFHNSILTDLAKKHHKTTAQIMLRWLIQRGIIVIPKSVHDDRQKENIDVFDFELTSNDMEKINHLDEASSQFFDHRDPESIKQIFGSDLNQLKG